VLGAVPGTWCRVRIIPPNNAECQRREVQVVGVGLAVLTQRIAAPNNAERQRREVQVVGVGPAVLTKRIAAPNNAERQRREVQVVGVGPHDTLSKEGWDARILGGACHHH
jgi:hypothetical protein